MNAGQFTSTNRPKTTRQRTHEQVTGILAQGGEWNTSSILTRIADTESPRFVPTHAEISMALSRMRASGTVESLRERPSGRRTYRLAGSP